MKMKVKKMIGKEDISVIKKGKINITSISVTEDNLIIKLNNFEKSIKNKENSILFFGIAFTLFISILTSEFKDFIF